MVFCSRLSRVVRCLVVIVTQVAQQCVRVINACMLCWLGFCPGLVLWMIRACPLCCTAAGLPIAFISQLKLWHTSCQQCWCGGPLGAHFVVAADSVASAIAGQQWPLTVCCYTCNIVSGKQLLICAETFVPARHTALECSPTINRTLMGSIPCDEI